MKKNSTSAKDRANSGTVYLLHFWRPFKHAKHYLGFSQNLNQRIADHLCGRGARLLEVVTLAGIEWRLARTWKGDRSLERRLKRWKGAGQFCPVCLGEATAKKRAVFNVRSKKGGAR